MVQRRTVYSVQVGKRGGNRPGVRCIRLTQDRNTWRAAVNMVMTVRVPLTAANSRLAEELLTHTNSFQWG